MMESNHSRIPPKWAEQFLHWYCKTDLVEEIEGDIRESYHDHHKLPKWRADLYFILLVFSFLKPFAVKKLDLLTQNNTMMYNNYFKVAVRNLLHDKMNSFISIFGLMLAYTCSVLIYQVVRHELSYDSFHENSDHIYRVILESKRGESSDLYPTVGPPLGPGIKAFYPGIKDAVRFRYTPSRIISTEDGEKRFYEEKVFYVDPSIFNVFTYPLRSGNARDALAENSNIVITGKMADKYFPGKDPLGKLLIVDGEIPYKVSGVLEAIPSTSHFEFDFLLPFDAFKVPFGYPVTLDDFGWTSFHTYVLLDENANPEALEAEFPAFARTHFDEEQAKRLKYSLQPLSEIYFSEIEHEDTRSGNKSYLVILSSIGILLLILAAFNFTNIWVAKSMSRAKETGLRKTLGSSKYSLVNRYLSEPLLISILAISCSFLISPFLLSQLNYYFELNVEGHAFRHWIDSLILFIPASILIGIISGIYPAMIMSSYKPVTMLQGTFSRTRGGAQLRNILVIFQYVITSFLIVVGLVISSQVHFLQTKNLGFNKEEILLVRMPGEELTERYKVLKNTLLQNSRVLDVSVGGGRLDGENGNVPILAEGFEDGQNLPIDAVREDFYKVIGVEVIAGREFEHHVESDSADGIILNREATRYFNWSPDEAIGKKMRIGNIMEGKVIGVVENFHHASLHNPISPLVIYYPRGHLEDIYIRVTPGDAKGLIAGLQQDWLSINPNTPFDFIFLNDHLQNLYRNDIQFSILVKIFSAITILLSILGLYGLISLVSSQRIKEISIRKVFGAPYSSLVMILIRSYLLIIIIANILAGPVAYKGMELWLQEFAYHTEIRASYFLVALLVTLLFSFLILVFQSRKVAVSNPVDTLKYE